VALQSLPEYLNINVINAAGNRTIGLSRPSSAQNAATHLTTAILCWCSRVPDYPIGSLKLIDQEGSPGAAQRGFFHAKKVKDR